MTQPVDVAYVDIVVRDKSLTRAKKDIKDALDDIDKDLERSAKDIEDSFEKTFDDIDQHFKTTAKSVTRSLDQLADDADKSLTRIGRGVPMSTGRLTRAFHAVRATVGDIADNIQERLTTALRKFGDVASNVLTTLGQFAGILGSFVSSSPLLALILVLIPVIIALAAALSNLIGLVGLLPAGLGILLAAIIPVVVAFQNFGEAVSALLSGDIEKINEAMSKLSVSARNVAREVAAAVPALRGLQRTLQEAFFSQVRGSFTLLTQVLLQLQSGLAGITGAMGRLFTEFVKFTALPGTIQVLNELFALTARIIDGISPILFRFLDAIGSVVHESLPFVERLASAFGRALDTFTAFINRAVESGDFDKFIEDAITTVKELLDLLKAVGGLIGTIFASTEESGHDLIKSLTEMTRQLDAFLQTAQGQRVLEDLVFLVRAFVAVLGGAISAFVIASQIFHNSLDVLELIGKALAKAASAVGDFFSRASDKASEFGNFIETVPEQLGAALSSAIATVGQFADFIIEKIRSIGAFLVTVPNLIGNALRAALDRALFTIGAAIGLILFAIQVLPGKIVQFLANLPELINSIVTRVRDVMVNAFNTAVTLVTNLVVEGFNAIVAFIQSIPFRIGLVLVTVIPIVTGIIRDAVTFARNLVVDGFNAIVAFIASVPGRIGALASTFLQAGRNLIQSFMNGFRAVGSFIGDVAGDIVSGVKGFLNKAIDRINSGIAAIDAVLPGDLARIPRLASGALIRHRPGGILANVGEGSEDEVVAPISKLADALRSVGFAGGPSVTFGPGSVNVSFSGAVPTPAEARTTGQAVGEGILSTLQKRNLRAQVRAI